MSIISVSGRINSGKDTVGLIIQYLIWKSNVEKGSGALMNYKLDHFRTMGDQLSGWKIKKFADKLKDIVCLLIGCSREQLEDRDFKEKELGEEWWKYDVRWNHVDISNGIFSTYEEAKQFALNIGASENNIENIDVIRTIKLTPRLLMQLMGTECCRDIIHPNCWVNALFAGYKPITTTESFYDEKANNYTGITNKSTTSFPNWIITDTRFENELKAVKDRGGITIRVNREIKHQVESVGGRFSLGHDVTPLNEHESETSLDSAIFDYVIENNSDLISLIEKVRIILVNEKII